MDHYILDGKRVVAVDMLVWATWFERADRVVAKTQIDDDVSVSTVFLGIDHNFGSGAPLLFETMVFGGDHDEEMDRYTTWEQAEAGHYDTVDRITGQNVVPIKRA